MREFKFPVNHRFDLRVGDMVKESDSFEKWEVTAIYPHIFMVERTIRGFRTYKEKRCYTRNAYRIGSIVKA